MSNKGRPTGRPLLRLKGGNMKFIAIILLCAVLVFGMNMPKTEAETLKWQHVESWDDPMYVLFEVNDVVPVAVIWRIFEERWIWAIPYQDSFENIISGEEPTLELAKDAVEWQLYGRRFI